MPVKKLFVSFWYNRRGTKGMGSGTIDFPKPVSTDEDLEEIAKEITKQLNEKMSKGWCYDSVALIHFRRME